MGILLGVRQQSPPEDGLTISLIGPAMPLSTENKNLKGKY